MQNVTTTATASQGFEQPVTSIIEKDRLAPPLSLLITSPFFPTSRSSSLLLSPPLIYSDHSLSSWCRHCWAKDMAAALIRRRQRLGSVPLDSPGDKLLRLPTDKWFNTSLSLSLFQPPHIPKSQIHYVNYQGDGSEGGGKDGGMEGSLQGRSCRCLLSQQL